MIPKPRHGLVPAGFWFSGALYALSCWSMSGHVRGSSVLSSFGDALMPAAVGSRSQPGAVRVSRAGCGCS